MKGLLIGLLLSSTQLFAVTQNCEDLFGEYTCNYQGRALTLAVTKSTNSENALVIDIAGEGGEFIYDGMSHQSSYDDTTYIAECRDNNEFIIDNYVANNIQGSVSFAKREQEYYYNIIKSSSRSVELKCQVK